MTQIRGEWLGDKVKGAVRDATVNALLDAANEAKVEAAKIAPKQTGELASSAYADVDPRTLIAIVGFDVPRTIKAIKQHEDLTYHHPSGESAKFLEKPVKAARGRLSQRLRTILSGVLN